MMAPLGRRTRAARRRTRRLGQSPTAATVAGSLPRTAAREPASVGPTWIALVERFAQLPVGDEPAHVWTNASRYAVRSARALRAANARTVTSTGENVAQGAAKKKEIIEELLGGLKLALDMSLRRTGRERGGR